MGYYPEDTSDKNLKKLIRDNVCSMCGRDLRLFLDRDTKQTYIACPTPGHEGIVREYIPSQIEENSYKGGIRRMEQVRQEHGPDKARALVKYQAVTSLTQKDAMEIMETIWPDAPLPDKKAAALLCAGYNLNPLMNHVFLIKFNKKKDGRIIGAEWARVLGIKAKRLISSRQGAVQYLDMSPRIMTEEEQIKAWGKVDNANVCFMTHLRDAKSGAEAYGFGKWPKMSEPYGTDKGNSKENMSAIRSESQALDRLRPGEMPTGVAIADEQYVDTDYKIEVSEEVEPVVELATKEILNDLYRVAQDKGWEINAVTAIIINDYGKATSKELTILEASDLLAKLEAGPPTMVEKSPSDVDQEPLF